MEKNTCCYQSTDIKSVLLIALGWALIDLLYLFIRLRLPGISPDRDLFNYSQFQSLYCSGH